MHNMLPNPSDRGHHIKAELRAKAELNNVETVGDTWKADIGKALARAIQLRGWTLKEFAAATGLTVHDARDMGQCSRWINGQERPQLDVIMPVLGRYFVQAMAELAEGVTVTTTISFDDRRRA